MPERLAARHTLAGDAALRRAGYPAVIALAEQPPRGALALRLDAADAWMVQRAREALGVPLPLAPNTGHADGGIEVLWQACDEWLVLTPDGHQGEAAARLARTLTGRHAAVTDVSDLFAGFTLTGPASTDVLRKGCAVDLHPREFRTGQLALTMLARVRVVLRRTGDAPQYEVMVERSYAQYLWDWLVDAAREFIP